MNRPVEFFWALFDHHIRPIRAICRQAWSSVMGRYQPPAGAVEGEVLRASSTWLSKARFVQNDNFRTISIMIRLSNITARYSTS